MTIEALKYAIIEDITHVKNEQVLLQIKDLMEQIAQDNAIKNRRFKPARKKITIADLKKEQNYQGVNRDKINEAICHINIQEPIELLLTQSKF